MGARPGWSWALALPCWRGAPSAGRGGLGRGTGGTRRLRSARRCIVRKRGECRGRAARARCPSGGAGGGAWQAGWGCGGVLGGSGRASGAVRVCVSWRRGRAGRGECSDASPLALPPPAATALRAAPSTRRPPGAARRCSALGPEVQVPRLRVPKRRCECLRPRCASSQGLHPPSASQARVSPSPRGQPLASAGRERVACGGTSLSLSCGRGVEASPGPVPRARRACAGAVDLGPLPPASRPDNPRLLSFFIGESRAGGPQGVVHTHTHTVQHPT